MATSIRQVWGPGWRKLEPSAQQVLDALPAAIYATDAAGMLTYYNPAAAKLWGHHPALGDAWFCGSWKLYWPDGRPMQHADCPMAVSLKEQRPIRGAEAIIERPDGSRVPFRPFPTPLHDDKGQVIGAVNLLVDLSDREQSERKERFLSAIVESSEDAILSKDLDGIITSWNKGATHLFGYAADEMIGKPVLVLIPPERQDEEPAILAGIRRGERIEHYETVRRRKDGTYIDISLTVSPIKNALGQIIGASKIARDITERRRHQEQQQLLYREMSHRVKNAFAVAGALLSVSAHTASSARELATVVQERLAALARAHELAQPGMSGGTSSLPADVTLAALVEAVLRPFTHRRAGHAPVHLSGPDLAVGAETVTPLALILQELATNAAKYGALSTASGRVLIGWSVNGGEFTMTWSELDGPSIGTRPDHEGFGSVLMRRMLEHQLGGQISSIWRPEGVLITITAPLEHIGMIG